MIINREKFYDSVKTSLFNGKLSQSQVDGMDAIINEYEARKLPDLRWLAAILGTARIETGVAMQPLEENLNYSAKGLLATWPKRFTPDLANQMARKPVDIANYVYLNRNGNVKPDDGWTYKGAGFCQITGRGNYAKMNDLANAAGHDFDLVNNPKKMLEIEPAVFALFEGEIRGMFTGKKLSDFLNSTKEDWQGCRSIINGKDKGSEYEKYCLAFYKAVT